MKRKLLGYVAAGTMVVSGVGVLSAGVASAHHPEITAEVVCDDATQVQAIYFTSTAWAGLGPDPTNDASRAHSRIEIAVDGALVATGAYVAPNYSFSGQVAIPTGKGPGDTVQITATAVGPWGTGLGGGEAASYMLSIPDLNCGVFDPALGRFTGGGSQLRVGEVRVTRGFTLHCDRLLSNNLEVNWGGQSFHMTEHVETVACTDDPNIIQAPPPAPVDTIIGRGTGRLKNASGYTIEFTLIDEGEPGRLDRAALKIYQTSNPSNVVLNVPLQVISGGNIQAHYDQPHK